VRKTKEINEGQSEQGVLAVNGGSSSIKFALYQVGEPLQRILSGKIDRIGLSGTSLTFSYVPHGQQGPVDVEASDHNSAVNYFIDWLEEKIGFTQVTAIGHRVVHGMSHTEPERITPALLGELRDISDYDPEHLPGEIALIEAFRQRYPQLPQVACFDTAFHRSMPRVARLLPIPRRFDAMGVQRYGFHGLSYAYLMQQLEQIAGLQAAQGRVIFAHLGNGASLAAVRDGRSIDTSMGFTPAGGLAMGTRSGDLDPGVAWYMMQREHLTSTQFNHLINHESGLIGMSGSSSDMRDLLEQESSDVHVAEAVDVFCYQVKKWIGAFAAAMGGLDTLVFAGGIGEHAALVRARICAGLEFLGIEIEEKSNVQNADVISTETGRVVVRIMHTDEELMIAKSVCGILGLTSQKEHEYGQ
jgi:acetate kinase